MKIIPFRPFILVVNITALIYLLSFSGRPISDDEQLFSSVARNLAVLGDFTADQLYGNLRLMGSYHGVEPAFPMLASLWYRLFQHSEFGHLQSLYLLPILYTSFSAGLLVVLAVQLGYSEKTGIVSGLLFGLATMAWPYAKTLFRETLTTLLLLGGLVLFNQLKSLKSGQRIKKYLLSVIFLISLLLLIFTKVTMGVVLIGYLGLLWFQSDISHPKVMRWALGGLLLIGGLWFLLTQNATDQDVLYRYSSGFLQAVYNRLMTISHSNLREAILAPLFSPWKGLLWYSPVCLLAVIPLAYSKYRRIELLILPSLVLAGFLVPQALFYDSEWATSTWGSRFLVPLIPLLIVSAFPFIHSQLELKKYMLLLIIFLLGVIIQLPAVVYNSAEYSVILYEKLGQNYPDQIIWNIRESPIIMQWQMYATSSPDLLLWRVYAFQPKIEWLLFLYFFLLLLLFILIVSQVFHSNVDNLGILYGLTGLGLFSIVTLSGFVLSIARYDPIYYGKEYKVVCGYIQEQLQPKKDILVVESYPGAIWLYLMNNECGQLIWYSLPLSEDVEADPKARVLVENLYNIRISPDQGVWLIASSQSISLSPKIPALFLTMHQHVSDKYFPDLKVSIVHYISTLP